jgi:mono/diheme cytochrome c family protein
MLKLDIKSALRTVGLSFLLAVALAGCNGGTSPIAGPGPDNVNQVTGVAATGAPIIGKVTLKDSSSPAVELTTSTASDGSFAFDTAKLASPFIIRTTSGTHTYFSVADSGSGIHNVNPLTTVIVSLAAGGVDLDTLYTAGSSTTLASIVKNLPTAETTVQTALEPILKKFGVTGSLMNSNYVADHTGVDAIFDVINISIASGTVTLKNISDSAVIFTAPAGSIASFNTGSVALSNIPEVPVQSWGAEQYRANCTRCHGDIMNSSVIGRSSVDKIIGAISTDIGGMGTLGELSYDAVVAINDALSTVVVPVVVPGSLSGDTLYANKCTNSGCHGPLATSKKLGITTVRLQNAIANNVGKMGYLNTLSTDDIQAIVLALNPASTTPTTPTSPTTPTILDGAAIYAANCEGCHALGTARAKPGMTAARFTTAVTTSATNTTMGYLSTLSTAEITALVDFLTTTTTTPTPTPTTPPDGATIYATNCAGCHGPLATSTKSNMTVARFNASVSSNGVSAMGYLSSLSVADIAALVNALVKAPDPTVTVSYATACASCHGALNSSTKGGKTAAQIQAAITSNAGGTAGGMGYLSSLSSSQVSAIALELVGIAPPVVADTGTALYTAYCQGCHGLYTASGKGGKTTQLIQAAITNNTGNMKTTDLQSLTTTQIGLIATLLSGVTPVAKDYASQCANCHSPKATPTAATSTKGGTTAAKISQAITANRGGMGYLSTLTTTEINAIVVELSTRTPLTCGDTTTGGCHGIGLGTTLTTGKHSKHSSRTCANCHGAGYTTTGTSTITTLLTHNDGKTEIPLVAEGTTGIVTWVKPDCTASCHSKKITNKTTTPPTITYTYSKKTW